MDLKQHIRSIPDFPKEGILFYDISTLLAHAGAWRSCVDQLTAHVKPLQADLLVGIEISRFPDSGAVGARTRLRLCHDTEERQTAGPHDFAHL